jgi:hypothetical protein
MDKKEIIYITPQEAIDMIFQVGFGRPTVATIHNWSRKYKIGIKVGGQWRIDKEKLENFLKGKKR